MRWFQLATEHRCDFVTQLWAIFLPIRGRILNRLKAHSVAGAPHARCPVGAALVHLTHIVVSDGPLPLLSATLNMHMNGQFNISEVNGLQASLFLHDIFFHRQEFDHVTIHLCLRYSPNLCLNGKGIFLKPQQVKHKSKRPWEYWQWASESGSHFWSFWTQQMCSSHILHINGSLLSNVSVAIM